MAVLEDGCGQMGLAGPRLALHPCPSRRSTPGIDWTSGLPTLFGGWIDWVILQCMGLAYFSSSIERLVPSPETWGEVIWP